MNLVGKRVYLTLLEESTYKSLTIAKITRGLTPAQMGEYESLHRKWEASRAEYPRTPRKRTRKEQGPKGPHRPR